MSEPDFIGDKIADVIMTVVHTRKSREMPVSRFSRSVKNLRRREGRCRSGG
jgi:hypothetical protein